MAGEKQPGDPQKHDDISKEGVQSISQKVTIAIDNLGHYNKEIEVLLNTKQDTFNYPHLIEMMKEASDFVTKYYKQIVPELESVEPELDRTFVELLVQIQKNLYSALLKMEDYAGGDNIDEKEIETIRNVIAAWRGNILSAATKPEVVKNMEKLFTRLDFLFSYQKNRLTPEVSEEESAPES